MSDRQKYPRAAALAVARELCAVLKPACERLIVAGSLRRRKDLVGDVEIVYAPIVAEIRAGLFEADTQKVSAVDCELDKLQARGVIGRRRNVNGSEMWGEKNKLAFHCASGVPVDFFAATAANWFNYLVCRTGGARSNTEIAAAAKRKGWQWNPYGAGFTNERGELVRMASERDVFAFAGLPWREPWERL